MKASPAAIELIKKWEGFEPEPYYCSADKLTIGFGHAIRQGELFYRITEEDAEALLKKDLQKASAVIKNLVTVPLHQEHFDALASFIYNIGGHSFKNSTMLRYLNNGKYVEAGAEFDRWVYVTQHGKKKRVNGLINRRNDEEELFLSLPWRKPQSKE